MRNLYRLFAIVIAFGGILHANMYNPVVDFNTTSNPNGVWTYGSSSTEFGSVTPLPVSDVTTSPTFDFWLSAPLTDPFPGYYPLIRFNASGAEFDDGNGFTVPVDRLSLEPSNSLLAVLRFTAPSSGWYRISGSFLGLQLDDVTPTDAIALITLSGAALFQEDVVNTDTDADLETFDLVQFLTVGDALDFRVQTAATLFGDSVGLSLVIEDIVEPGGEIPEPSSMTLVAAGIVVLLWRTNRTRKRGRVTA